MLGNISAMFTGKPHVAELGYAFLFRNYNSSLGKWSTADPLGYPDGWNNFAYCNNWAINAIDWQGTWSLLVGAVVGGVIGGVSGYITSGGNFSATIAGTLGGVIGGALAATGIPGASVIGGAITSGLTTALNKYLDDGNLSTEDLKDTGISATVGFVIAAGTGTLGGKIIDGIEDVHAGNISPEALAAMEGFSAGVVAEMGNVINGLTLDLLNNTKDFVKNNRYLYE